MSFSALTLSVLSWVSALLNFAKRIVILFSALHVIRIQRSMRMDGLFPEVILSHGLGRLRRTANLLVLSFDANRRSKHEWDRKSWHQWQFRGNDKISHKKPWVIAKGYKTWKDKFLSTSIYRKADLSPGFNDLPTFSFHTTNSNESGLCTWTFNRSCYTGGWSYYHSSVFILGC